MSARILLVEDEKPIAHALELKLQKNGYEPTVVSNGEEAVSALEAGSYDLILLDLVMPKLDGFGLLEKIAEMKKLIPVIILSNLGQQEDIEKAKNLGAKDFFIKSDTQLSEIVAYIQKLLK